MAIQKNAHNECLGTANAQADLNFGWVLMSEGMFSDVAARIPLSHSYR